jgi:hypothetical protein
MVAQRAGGGVSAAANTAAAAGAARTQDLSLLRRPRVFTVAIVWESAQVLQLCLRVVHGMRSFGPFTVMMVSLRHYMACKMVRRRV